MNGISVVIVCYKSELELRGLIESIFFHADVPLHQLQIIVIDNYGNGLERVITDDLSKQYEHTSLLPVVDAKISLLPFLVSLILL